jgi:hypothetical protein
MSRWRTKIRNTTATSTMMIGPPTNSARVNCQPSSSAMMMPSRVAFARVTGRSSRSIRVIASRRTTAWTTAGK